MKKLFKLLTVAILTVAATVACVFVAGCNKGNEGGAATSDYNFTILHEDGTAVNGQTEGSDNGKVIVQICLPAEEGGMCVRFNTLKEFRKIDNIYPDENGKISLSQAKINELFFSDKDVTVFSFHVMNVPGYKSDCEIAINGKGNYPITLAK